MNHHLIELYKAIWVKWSNPASFVFRPCAFCNDARSIFRDMFVNPLWLGVCGVCRINPQICAENGNAGLVGDYAPFPNVGSLPMTQYRILVLIDAEINKLEAED